MKILIIEDEKKLAKLIARGLHNLGYTADIINDGEAALKRIILYHEDYNLVILDLSLPSMQGEEICAEIRKQKISVPIIILTAANKLDSKVKLLYAGADDYISKPFSFKELDARIQAILRRPATNVYIKLNLNDIELDPAERIVKRDGKEITLTLKEFAILEYFMRNPNRVINREELLSNLWDFNYTSFFSNALDVHIKNLRKKIDYEDSQSIIETVRGIGYRVRS